MPYSKVAKPTSTFTKQPENSPVIIIPAGFDNFTFDITTFDRTGQTVQSIFIKVGKTQQTFTKKPI